jgi:hypothetical protein
MKLLENYFIQIQQSKPGAPIHRHRTLPIAETITRIEGYPQKLIIFRTAASRFWQVRYYEDGKVIRRTTKTTNKATAMQRAKEFFADFVAHRGMSSNLRTRFETVAFKQLEYQQVKLLRGELTQITQENDQNRLRRDILPFFRNFDISEVDFNVIDSYLTHLTVQVGRGRTGTLSNSSIQLHLTHIGKILRFAHRQGLIEKLPALPTVKRQDRSRDYFTPSEVDHLLVTAHRLIGDRDVICAKGTGKFVRNVEISEDIGDLIEFMLYAFIRPTDLKVLQHQHIAIVRREQTYLRLTQPETKRHSQPMITMPQAVGVYERLLARRMSVGPIRPSDPVFFPEWPDRQYAIVQMRRQFDLVLKRAGLKLSGRGESRTLYCLRHTAIMERLLNGDKIDVLSLARNSRTSVEMIERFYARHLHGEMVVAKLQSSFVFDKATPAN